MNIQMPLLDYLAQRTGCVYLSDLRQLDQRRQFLLVHTLENLAPEDASLKEWNDALIYLTGASPAETAQEARAQLLILLDRFPGQA